MRKLMIGCAAILALGGCGVVEGITGTVTGVVVREHETEHLRCATAAISDAISVSCVPREVTP